MSKTIIFSDAYPKKAQLSPAVRVDNSRSLICCSGQIGRGEIKAATTDSLRKLGDVLRLGGSDLDKVVKFNIFLTDMDDYDSMNEVFNSTVPDPKPARTCVQIAKLPGPSDAVVEIECIALVD